MIMIYCVITGAVELRIFFVEGCLCVLI